ncbi:MAG TPA: Crp/Fnr family transcriptional regulator [Alphaproteobacteria bacterium]|nr:Crp/Fnr family transcriptional regulator [Alphaproteobacteria bacterium]
MYQLDRPECGNALLNALPESDANRLLAKMERVPLLSKDILHLPGEPIKTAHFIESGIIAILVVLENGDYAEVGVVGREGMIGLPLIFGAHRSPNEAMVVSAGTALEIGYADFKVELDRSPYLSKLMSRYLRAFYAQVSQTAACNGLHTLQQRLARWLLLAHDRSDGDDLDLTHEALSMMLCVHRPAISIAAGNLQKLGILEYRRGRIRILDRRGLETMSCECYAAVQKEAGRLLG